MGTLKAQQMMDGKPVRLTSRGFQQEDSVIRIGNACIGGGNLMVMAGPCSVESEVQIIGIAKAVKAAGAKMLRGGAFKPRTSPYSFQGLGVDGIDLLMKAREATGLPIVTELMDTEDFDAVHDRVDMIQIGARNMQNFSLLKKVGRGTKPILLKRGLSATIEEFLMAAEYIMAEGNPNVVLCERGIRTFETHMRNTLDLNVVTAIRSMSHLPIIIDPSHATGIREMVEPLSRAAIAIGADGLIVEVHNDPEHAWCDGEQSLHPEAFHRLMDDVTRIRQIISPVVKGGRLHG